MNAVYVCVCICLSKASCLLLLSDVEYYIQSNFHLSAFT